MSTATARTDRSARASARRTGWTSVRRATVLLLWQVAPWVLLVLVVLSGASTAWASWAGGRGEGPLIIEGDGGAAGGVSLYVGLAMLATWMRAIRTAVPALVAGGITRRATTAGVLVGTTALAVVSAALLTVVALVGATVQRGLATRAATTVVPSSGSDAYTSSLTISYDAPEVLFNPVETFPWFVIASLGGALIGVAWYRWRAHGAAGVLVVVGGAWAVYLVVVSGYVVDPATRVVDAVPASPLLDALPCLVLAVGVWLVLRRTPLREPAR